MGAGFNKLSYLKALLERFLPAMIRKRKKTLL